MIRPHISTTARRSRKPKVAGLFAGIGGFELGFEREGFESALLCDVDPRAQAVLRHRFSNTTLLSDVREIDSLPDGTTVLTAGFPCQDLSSIGLKDGIKGARSSLVDEVFRILQDNPVPWVVIENVHFMLRLRKGEAIKRIVDNLERLGYKWAYRVLDSQSFGVPHRRKRVFVVAALNDDPRRVLFPSSLQAFEAPSAHGPDALASPIGFYWTEGTYATGLARNAVPPLKGGSTIGIPSPPAILFPDGSVGTPDIRDAERLQGFDPGWTEAVESVGRASGRWSLVGNAVTVNVAQWIAQRIIQPQSWRAVEGARLKKGDSWPDCAWSVGEGRFGSRVSHYPHEIAAGLDTFLQHPAKPLSRKATEGFLKRVDAGGLRFPTGFITALARYSDHIQVAT